MYTAIRPQRRLVEGTESPNLLLGFNNITTLFRELCGCGCSARWVCHWRGKRRSPYWMPPFPYWNPPWTSVFCCSSAQWQVESVTVTRHFLKGLNMYCSLDQTWLLFCFNPACAGNSRTGTASLEAQPSQELFFRKGRYDWIYIFFFTEKMSFPGSFPAKTRLLDG